MDFTLTEDEKLVRDSAREFADKVVAPRAAEFDKAGAIPREIFAKAAEQGLMGMITPEALGGAGAGNVCLALAMMEINRACAATGVTISVHNSLVQGPLNRFGTEEQKKRWLPKLASGTWIGAYSLSEPGSGSDAGALTATAFRNGDHYVLNGTKNFVTNGQYADLFIVFARTSRDVEAKTKGISAIVVEKGTPGFTVCKNEHKMGIRGSSTTELSFADCKVPASNLLGVENEGFKVAMNTLDGGRIGIASQAVGIAQASLDAAQKYSRERKQFDRPIGDFQAIQWKLADMAVAIDAARLLVLRAAKLRDLGQPCTTEACMAKLFASEACNKAATEAVQIHGGAGYCRDYPVERYFRDAKITEIYEGTSEVQRLVIARSLVK